MVPTDPPTEPEAVFKKSLSNTIWYVLFVTPLLYFSPGPNLLNLESLVNSLQDATSTYQRIWLNPKITVWALLMPLMPPSITSWRYSMHIPSFLFQIILLLSKSIRIFPLTSRPITHLKSPLTTPVWFPHPSTQNNTLQILTKSQIILPTVLPRRLLLPPLPRCCCPSTTYHFLSSRHLCHGLVIYL